jgi:hypothetical protein
VLPAAPPRGPPSTFSSSSVVASPGGTDSTPEGPAIDVWLNLVPVTSILLATPTKGLLVPCRPGTPAYKIQVKTRSRVCITRCHVPCSSRPRLLIQVGSDNSTCPVAPDLAFLPRWALVLPRVPWPQASPPCKVELQRYHVFLSFGPHLPAEVGLKVP